MNVTKFLALKIAEAALALADDAEHIAERHSQDADAPCYESLKESGGRLAFTMMVAAQNGIIPHGTAKEGDALKAQVKAELFEEVMEDLRHDRIVIDRPFVLV